MIKVKHPLAHCNKLQEDIIKTTPENELKFNELLFSLSNATYLYHNRAKDFEPTARDFNEWLSGLAPTIRKDVEERGFSGCLGILSFTRYVNEKNDIGMEKYIKGLMGLEDYANYRELIDNG